MTSKKQPPETRADTIVRWLKNRWPIAVIVAIGGILVFISTVTDSITKIEEFVARHRNGTTPHSTHATVAPHILLPASMQVGPEIAAATKLIREQRAYEVARQKLEQLDREGNPDGVRTAVQGLVIATYYGSKKDREGLEYTCSLYLTRPRDDVRFRFAIQAFLRRIALREGFDAAETLVTNLRASCDRQDLSYVWAGIPLAKAEYLSQGKTTFEEFYDLSDEDKGYLQYVLERYPDDAFADHALYFLGRFDEVISNYPKSTILDVVYRSLAKRTLAEGNTAAGIGYLQTALDKWPRSTAIARDLAAAYLQSGAIKDYLELRKRFVIPGDSRLITILGRSLPIHGPKELRAVLKSLAQRAGGFGEVRDLFDQDCTKTFRLASDEIEEEHYSAAIDRYRTSIAVFREFNLQVPACVSIGDRILERILGVVGDKTGESVDSLFAFGFYLRDQAEKETGEASFEAAAATVWQRTAIRFPSTREAEKSLYLAGALLRRNENYGKAMKLFVLLAKLYPKSDLADDALVEAGWYYLLVEGNRLWARRFFEQVATAYRGRNAADNALYWMARSYYTEGDFANALRVHQRLIREYPLGRLAGYSRSFVECLQPIVRGATKTRAVTGLFLDITVPGGLYVLSVPYDTAAAKAGLRKGDLIKSINGRAVSTIEDFVQMLAEANQPQVDLEVRRGLSTLTLRAGVTTGIHYERMPRCRYAPRRWGTDLELLRDIEKQSGG